MKSTPILSEQQIRSEILRIRKHWRFTAKKMAELSQVPEQSFRNKMNPKATNYIYEIDLLNLKVGIRNLINNFQNE